MSIEKKRMLIFDDDEEFAKSITMKPWVMQKWEATTQTNADHLDESFKMNDGWDVIITDVNIQGSQFDGHELIKRRVEERRLNVPVIVLSGATGVDLVVLREQYGMFFSAYISKDDDEFSSKLMTEVDKAVSKSDPLARLREIFKELGKLDAIVSQDGKLIGLQEIGIIDLSENETIENLLDQCEKMEDKEQITGYLWGKVEVFLKKRSR